MPKLRPARLSLLLAGVGAAVVLAPGVAWAAPSPPAPGVDPLGTVQQQVQDAAGGLLPGNQGGAGAAPNLSTDQTATDTTTSSSSPGTPAAPTLPPQLQALLDKLSLSSSCSAAIQGDLTKTLTDIPSFVTGILGQLGSSPDPQKLVTALQNALGMGGTPGANTANAAAATTTPDLPGDLQKLVADLSSCLTLPTQTSTTPPSTSAAAPVSEQSVQTTPPPPPPAAQPVSYPGYAPTGTIAAPGTGEGSGLAALGGGVLLAGAAATAAVRVRARAARGGR